MEEGPGEIGAVEHPFEQIRPFQVRAGEICPGAIGSPQIGTAKVGTRKIEPAQIEATQAGPGQIRRLVVFRPPAIPCPSTASEQ